MRGTVRKREKEMRSRIFTDQSLQDFIQEKGIKNLEK